MSHITEKMLPELPASRGFIQWHSPQAVNQAHGYTSTQMHDYARAALEAALSQGEAVAFDTQVADFLKGCPVAWLIHWSSFELEAPELTRNAGRVTEIMALDNPPRVEPLYLHPQPTPQSEPAGDVTHLIASWRAEADIHESNELEADSVGLKVAATRHEMRAGTLRGCANELEAALAATGKQPGSEPVPHRWDDVGERCLACGDKDWMADPSCRGAATESRETAGVEPVAVVGSDFTICWVGSGPIAPLVERNGIKKGIPLYAAPPAQGVDLGQFREAVNCWLSFNLRVEREALVTPQMMAEARNDANEARRLQALIDQQRDSGAGVKP